MAKVTKKKVTVYRDPEDDEPFDDEPEAPVSMPPEDDWQTLVAQVPGTGVAGTEMTEQEAKELVDAGDADVEAEHPAPGVPEEPSAPAVPEEPSAPAVPEEPDGGNGEPEDRPMPHRKR